MLLFQFSELWQEKSLALKFQQTEGQGQQNWVNHHLETQHANRRVENSRGPWWCTNWQDLRSLHARHLGTYSQMLTTNIVSRMKSRQNGIQSVIGGRNVGLSCVLLCLPACYAWFANYVVCTFYGRKYGSFYLPAASLEHYPSTSNCVNSSEFAGWITGVIMFWSSTTFLHLIISGDGHEKIGLWTGLRDSSPVTGQVL